MKKAFKENMKLVITAIVSIIISSSITAFAAIKISAAEIGYNNTTVADQLDSLYQTMFSNNYSTEEKQIGKWIDGKPLYQITKVFPRTSYIQSDYLYIPVDNIENIVSYKVYHQYNDGHAIEDMRYGNANYYIGNYVTYIDANIKISIENKISNISSYSYICTFQYTKTTDQPQTN